MEIRSIFIKSQTPLEVNSFFSLAARYWPLAASDFSYVYNEKSGVQSSLANILPRVRCFSIPMLREYCFHAPTVDIPKSGEPRFPNVASGFKKSKPCS